MTTLGTGNIIQGTVIVIEITMVVVVVDIAPALTHQGVSFGNKFLLWHYSYVLSTLEITVF